MCLYILDHTLQRGKKKKKVLDLVLRGFVSCSLRHIFHGVDALRLLRLGCTFTDGVVLNFWRPKKNSFRDEPVRTRLRCHGGGLVYWTANLRRKLCFPSLIMKSPKMHLMIPNLLTRQNLVRQHWWLGWISNRRIFHKASFQKIMCWTIKVKIQIITKMFCFVLLKKHQV